MALRFLIILWSMGLAACQGFEASQHPDELLNGRHGLSNVNQLNAFVHSQGNNPQFRKAKVTTHSIPLKVKSAPNDNSVPPPGAPSQLRKNEVIYIYWPQIVSNNHIKIFIENTTAWVTHKSINGLTNVTLIEDLAIPTFTANNASILNNFTLPQTYQPILAPPSFPTFTPSPLNIDTIFMSQVALQEAHAAVRAVHLTSAEVPTCSFNPLVGNSSSSPNCYQKIVISSAFRDFISQYAYSCAQQASQITYGQNAQKIIFHSSGAGQVRRNRTVSSSGKKSVHSIGQAIDLFAISLYQQNGAHRRVEMHRDHVDGSSNIEKQNNQFYWSYVNCWRQKIKTHAPCNCSTTKNGAITYQDDSSHYNHVHMSLPFCQRSQFNVSCV